MEQQEVVKHEGFMSPPRLKDKVIITHQKKGEPFILKLHASLDAERTRDEKGISLHEYGFKEEYLKETVSRPLRISRRTGLPLPQDNPTEEVVAIMIEGAMLSVSVMEEDSSPNSFRIVMVGCEHQTYYMCLFGDRHPMRFYAPVPSYHVRHALVALINMHLFKGPQPYERMASIVPGFFTRAFTTAYETPCIISLSSATIKGKSAGEFLKLRFFFTPHHPEKTILSVNGWCFDFDVDLYPKWQQIVVERHLMSNTPKKRLATQAYRDFHRAKKELVQS